MNKTRKLLPWLLSMAIIISVCPLSGLTILSSNAAETVASGSCGDDVTYTLDSDGLLTISGTGDMADYSWYNSPWREKTFSKVIISNGVTSIGYEAFCGCTGLTSITIGNGVTIIGDKAFRGCTGLTNITIPDSVTNIEYMTFKGCTGLTSISIPDSVTSIGSYAFHGCTGLTSITIPKKVTTIGDRAFYDCSGIMSITIPASVTSIGEDAFDCDAIESISVDKNNSVYHSSGNCLIETKSKTLLFGCKNSVIPADGSVTSIGKYAFNYCSGLTNITIPSGVTSIGYEAFFRSGIKSITIPDSVTNIETGAFHYSNLEKVVIPDSVTEIGIYAFAGCQNLTDVTLGKGLKEISYCCFEGCEALKNVVISEGVTTICEFAFSGCSGIEKITFPDSITDIYEFAFSGCSGLSDFTVPAGVKSICALDFNSDNLKNIYILNPDCELNFTYCGEAVDFRFNEDKTVIHSHTGGKLEKFANENNYKFEAMHIYDDTTVTVAATCAKAGQTYEKCVYCDEKTNVVEIPALGHDFTGTARKNADGTISYKCTRCNEYGGTVKSTEKKLDPVTGTKRLTQDKVDIIVTPVEMTAGTVLASANGAKLVDKDGKEVTNKKTPLATGMKVVLGDISVTISVAGDVDGDGAISVSDARLALRAAVQLDKPAEAYFTAANVDFADKVSVSDARLILRAAVKLDDPKKAWIK